MRHFLFLLLTVAALAAVGGAAYYGYAGVQPQTSDTPRKPVTVAVTQGDVQRTVTAPGQLVGTHEELLGMQVDGRLIELTVRPGSRVKQGDVIARLDPRPFQRALTTAEIELDKAQTAHRQQLAEAELAVENNAALVNSARAQVPALTAAEVRLQAAKDAEARAAEAYNKALDRHWETDETKEAYRLELVAQTNNRQIAQAEYDAVLAQQWGAGQQVAARQTEVERAQLNAEFLADQGVDPLLELAVAQAREALAATTLTAPFDGVVLAVMVKPGATVSAGTPLVLLADPAAAEVRTTVIEEDLPLTQIGQPAELFFDAQPDLTVDGAVARILPQRVPNEERPLYHVYIALAGELPPGILPGMTADAAIIVSRTAGVLRLPRALVNARSDGTATVEVWQNGRTVSTEITVGLRGDVYVEVLAGLPEGEEIVAE